MLDMLANWLGANIGVVKVFAAIVLGGLALEALLDYRAGRKLFQRRSLSDRMQSAFWFAILVALIFLPDILERNGYPQWPAYAAFGVLVFLPLLLFGWNRKSGQGRANPQAKPDEAFADAEKFSAEELKVNAKILGLLLAFGVVLIGGTSYVAFFLAPLSIAGLVETLGFVTVLGAILLFAVSGRWPGSLELKSSIVIQKPAGVVWDTIRFRDTTDWWQKIVRRVERLDQPGEHYKMHYYIDDTCAQCGLPRDPDGQGRANLVEILAVKPGQALHARSRGVGSPSVEGMMDCEEQIMTIEELGPGTTRVAVTNTVYRPKAWLAIVLKLGDPMGEFLRALKGRLDGYGSSSLYDAGTARIAAHRHAEKFCVCAPGTPIANKFIT